MFYLPHRTVIRESAKTTKLRIIYDASSKPTTKSSASLHDLKDLPLQNSMWDVLVRSDSNLQILLCGDIKKAFLQIRIGECERNVSHFHWVKNVIWMVWK